MNKLLQTIQKNNDRNNNTEVESISNKSKFNKDLFEAKMVMDLDYIKTLTELNENDMTSVAFHMYNLFEEVGIESTYKTPTLNRHLLNKTELNENEIIENYNRIVTKEINENYSMVINHGEFNGHFESDIKNLTEAIVINGLTDLNVEHFTKYAIFENELNKTIHNLFISESDTKMISNYINMQSESYSELFEENAITHLEGFNNAIQVITESIAPKLFKKSINLEESDTDITPYIGISVLL
jgi:hypothetical protein